MCKLYFSSQKSTKQSIFHLKNRKNEYSKLEQYTKALQDQPAQELPRAQGLRPSSRWPHALTAKRKLTLCMHFQVRFTCGEKVFMRVYNVKHKVKHLFCLLASKKIFWIFAHDSHGTTLIGKIQKNSQIAVKIVLLTSANFEPFSKPQILQCESTLEDLGVIAILCGNLVWIVGYQPLKFIQKRQKSRKIGEIPTFRVSKKPKMPLNNLILAGATLPCKFCMRNLFGVVSLISRIIPDS